MLEATPPEESQKPLHAQGRPAREDVGANDASAVAPPPPPTLPRLGHSNPDPDAKRRLEKIAYDRHHYCSFQEHRKQETLQQQTRQARRLVLLLKALNGLSPLAAAILGVGVLFCLYKYGHHCRSFFSWPCFASSTSPASSASSSSGASPIITTVLANVTTSSAVVDLNYTIYLGNGLKNGVNEFLGMRYAAPPLGNLRWRPPMEPDEVSGAVKASEFGPVCLGAGRGYPVDGQNEDCLFANVWAPANATTRSRLPVWVFIQGGGYNALTNANWNGSEVVEKSGHNIVLVNFNYRVGLWGFLASERVRNDGALNVGLLDQRMLLKWVKRHITTFGGDPEHIVIHGASAGAGSVAMHLVAYGGRNDSLFISGISEAIFFPAQPFVSELEYQFDRVVSQIGCDNVTISEQMSCLREKDVASVQSVNYAQAFPGRDAPPLPIFYFTPCIDGVFLEDLPYNLYKAGRFLKVPMIFGTSTNEGSVFAANAATQTDVALFFRNNYPLLTANDTDDILSVYGGPGSPLPKHAAWFPTSCQAYGEATFICPQTNVLDALSGGGPPHTSLSSTAHPSSSSSIPAVNNAQLYAYRFNVHDDENTANGMGVPHLFDAQAIFGADNINGGSQSYKTYNAPVIPRMMGYYISFVRTLNPNKLRTPGTPEWAGWRSSTSSSGDNENENDEEGSNKRMRLVFETDETFMEEVSREERGRCKFWEQLGRTRMEQR